MVTVRDILRNRAYLGTTRASEPRHREHPSLVSRKTSAASRTGCKRAWRHPHTHGHAFLLSGMLYCGKCQNKLIGVSAASAGNQAGEKKEAATLLPWRITQNHRACSYNTQRAPDLESRVRAALKDDTVPHPLAPCR